MTYHSEHFLVAELRDTAAYIPELSLVAEVQEEIVGHVLLSKIRIQDIEQGHPSLALAPVSVLPSYQNKKIGSQLILKTIEIGHGVRDLEAGDMVWADLSNPLSYGTFAQYVAVPESSLQKVPHNMKAEEVACLPTAGVVALQNVQKFQPQKGHKILGNGVSGGIGRILVQLLSYIGCDITAVDKLEKHPILRDLGPQRTINYREIDYSQGNIAYDYVYDLQAT